MDDARVDGGQLPRLPDFVRKHLEEQEALDAGEGTDGDEAPEFFLESEASRDGMDSSDDELTDVGDEVDAGLIDEGEDDGITSDGLG